MRSLFRLLLLAALWPAVLPVSGECAPLIVRTLDLRGPLRFERSERSVLPPLKDARKIQASDLDGDGDDDLIGYSKTGAAVRLQRGSELQEPSVECDLEVATNGSIIGTTDLDGDGISELIFAGNKWPLRTLRLVNIAVAAGEGCTTRDVKLPLMVSPLTAHAAPATVRAGRMFLWTRSQSIASLTIRDGRAVATAQHFHDGSCRTIGSADLERDGEPELLTCTQDLVDEYILRSTGVPIGRRVQPYHPLAELPQFSGCGDEVIGDLTGDGRDDVVRPPHGPFGGWAVIMWRTVGYERAISGLGSLRKDRLTMGRFAEPDRASVAVLETDETLAVLTPVFREVPKIRIALDGAPIGETDERGRLEIELPDDGEHRVALLDDAFRSPDRERSVTSRRRVLTFVGLPIAPGNPEGRYLLDEPLPAPYLCSGYQNGDVRHKFGRSFRLCSDNQVAVEADDADGATAQLTCCPVPPDALVSGADVAVPGGAPCPADHVITGVIRDDLSPVKFRCTRINTERYALGPPQKGLYWGEGFSMRSRTTVLSRGEMPLGIRLAIGRYSMSRWDSDGCVAPRVGSLLAGSPSSECERNVFRELLVRAPSGRLQPQPLTPVCQSIKNPYDPLEGCVPSRAAVADGGS